MLHIYLSNRVDRQKIGASGARVPGYELKLTDPEGKPVAEGESGVLWVRGDSQAPLYWNRPDKTAETMREGWICTGDRFRVDADGFYFFEGRIDDLIKVSGQWIYPLEVERCLAEHPSVQECAVLGVEEPNRLMTLAAFVVLRPGVEPGEATTRLLQNFVKSQLAALQVSAPRRLSRCAAQDRHGQDRPAGTQARRGRQAGIGCPASAPRSPRRAGQPLCLAGTLAPRSGRDLQSLRKFPGEPPIHWFALDTRRQPDSHHSIRRAGEGRRSRSRRPVLWVAH